MNESVDPATMREVRPAHLPEPEVAAPVRRRRPWVRGIVAVLIAVLAIFVWERWEKLAPGTIEAKKEHGKTTPPQTIRAAEATRDQMPITIDALGTVTPLATVTIHTQISGRLMSVGFKEGQLVKAGDFLAQVDPRPYQAALTQAQAQLAKDTAAYQQAQSDLARYQTLSKQDSISRQQVDDQVFLVAQDKAAVAVDQAQIQTATLNLDYTHIVSPIGGRIGLRLVDPGNFVQPSDTSGIAVVTELDPISVIFSTPEDNLPAISKRFHSGAKLQVTAFGRANVQQLAVGALTNIDNQIDTTTGTFKLRATFPNPDNVLFPSQFVNARLLVDTLDNVILVPNAAVQLGQKGPFVYVVKDGKTVEARQVKTGPANADQTVISSGLEAGESVVIDGVDRLRDGAAVRLAGAKPEATPAGGGAPGGHHRHGQHKSGEEGTKSP
jgi:multidrug efflux system membrane fusion protein